MLFSLGELILISSFVKLVEEGEVYLGGGRWVFEFYRVYEGRVDEKAYIKKSCRRYFLNMWGI